MHHNYGMFHSSTGCDVPASEKSQHHPTFVCVVLDSNNGGNVLYFDNCRYFNRIRRTDDCGYHIILSYPCLGLPFDILHNIPIYSKVGPKIF